MSKYVGSCLCGEVRFEIVGDFERFFLCHCGRCRKDTGSAHAANLFSSTAKVHWLSGQAKIKIFQVPSTRHQKSFCSACGSALPRVQTNGTLLVVPAGSPIGSFSKVAFKAALATEPGKFTCPRSGNDKPSRLDLAVLDDF